MNGLILSQYLFRENNQEGNYLTLSAMKERLPEYLDALRQQEKSDSTIRKYQGDIERFFTWTEGNADQRGPQEEITKEDIISYKARLIENYKTSSVNNYLIILNKYLVWLEAGELKAGVIRQQRRNSLDNMMSRSDYERLLRYAKKLNRDKIYYIMRTLAGTGIRIEELKYITVEAVTKGKGSIQVNNKGKIRDIVIASDLCKELKQYCKANNIDGGIIFHNRAGDDLIDKAYVWRELKYIAGRARVNKSKVHAHSFRHLFAKTFMEATGGNVVELADLLGHSSLETTRIYTRTTNREKRDKIAKLGL